MLALGNLEACRMVRGTCATLESCDVRSARRCLAARASATPTDRLDRWFWVVAAIALVFACVVMTPAASASPSLSWSGGLEVDQAVGKYASLQHVSCPSTTLCVAVDADGNVVTSTNPMGGAAAWTTTNIDGEEYIDSVSCPSISLCVAVDDGGNVITSTNPTGGPSAWTVSNVGVLYFTDVSCPTTTFCAGVIGGGALGVHGEVVTSTNPTGGPSAWHAADIDGETTLYGVSCASPTLCVAVDEAGGVLTSTNPTGGAGAWNKANVDGLTPLFAVSCPSTTLCIADDFAGNVITSTHPTEGVSAWAIAHVDGANALTGLACPSELLCVALDRAGQVLSSTNPTGGTSSWTPTAVALGHELSGVSCPSSSLCVALEYGKNAFVGTLTGEGNRKAEEEATARKRAEEEAAARKHAEEEAAARKHAEEEAAARKRAEERALARAAASFAGSLIPHGKAARIGSLLKRGGYSLSFNAPGAGMLGISWYQVPKGAYLAARRRPVLIAIGTTSYFESSTRRLTIKLTIAGKRLLKHSRSVRLTAKGLFSPKVGSTVVALRTFTLKR